MASVRVRQNSEAVLASGTRLRAAEVDLSVTEVPAGGNLRTYSETPEPFADYVAALDELGLQEQELVEVEPASGSSGTRDFAQDATIAVAPVLQPDTGQAILYQDPEGGLSWHLPDTQQGLRAGPEFRITLRSTPTAAALRGPLGTLVKHTLRIIAMPLLKGAAGFLVEKIVGAVERSRRHEVVRTVTADNLAHPPEAAAIAPLAGKRTLLVIHGTFSSTQGMLAGVPPATLRSWQAIYENRIIGLDHYTLTKTPEENARQFLEQLRQAGGGYEFDIVAHSRGGLVARVLAERAATLVPGANCTVRSVYFVATPNRGTALAQPDHLNDLVDAYTNFLAKLPDGPAIVSAQLIVALVQLLIHGQRAVPGLAAMDPTGWVAGTLNAPGTTNDARYAAASADYEPHKDARGLLTTPVMDAVLDRVFKTGSKPVPNDLVVPTNGVASENGNDMFPIRDEISFLPTEGVWHSTILANSQCLAHLLAHWEKAGVPVGLGRTLGGGSRSPKSLRKFRTMYEAPPPAFEPEMIVGAAPASEPAKPTSVRRDPSMQFHEAVLEGETKPLTINLNEARASAGGMEFAFPAGASEVSVEVELSAPGFTVDKRRDTMTVKSVRDPGTEEVVFHLTAESPGITPVKREISSGFWVGTRCVGSVRHWTTVIPKGWMGPVESDGSGASEPFVSGDDGRQEPDWLISVTSKAGNGQPPYNIRVASRIRKEAVPGMPLGVLEVDDAGKGLQEFLSTSYANLFRGRPRTEDEAAWNKWQQTFFTGLKAMGRRLWDFLPKELREEYMRLHAIGKLPASIMVASDEFLLPWELVVPTGDVNGKFETLSAWGQRHLLGRWSLTDKYRPDPQVLEVSKFLILNPKYVGQNALPWSEQEAVDIKAIIPKATQMRPLDILTVENTLLESPDVHFMHFTGHGLFDAGNADLSSLVLEGGDRLEAVRFTKRRIGMEAHPFLYLNACSVGASGVVAGHAGGFIATCVKSGFSGVIAPYWPIADDTAKDFSIGLYKKLLAGKSIGQALKELRQEAPDDPTVNAYAFFGDPFVTCIFN